MTVPPFPSQDLAKLVLGYLAEEQLMTAYDEFLQASPYLDAMRNEYDRLFMTSLRTILSEYRAVKIYVESCKPIALRRKLFSFTNLPELFKYLVQHIDLSKIQEVTSYGHSKEELNDTNVPNLTECQICRSQQQTCCVCNNRNEYKSQTESNCEPSASEISVETTVLEDLPGNHATTKNKHVKGREKDVYTYEGVMSEILPDSITSNPLGESHQNSSSASSSQLVICPDSASHSNGYTELVNYPVNADQQYVGDPNLDPVSGGKTYTNLENVNLMDNIVCNRESSAGTFQDFATGVTGTVESIAQISELNISSNHKNVDNTKDSTIGTYSKQKEASKNKIMLNVGNGSSFRHAGTLRPKPDPKITILSDVKVDNSKKLMPAVLKNATSTPVMQTILINGTTAYKRDAKSGPEHNFTKDEIMSMPTIILVPSSANEPPSIQLSVDKKKTVASISSGEQSVPARSLGPLVIDVLSNDSERETISNEVRDKPLLMKTSDPKNASIPKNCTVDNSCKNTPHVVPPKRKSLSTPRRTSHVRVLDFTAPRRILQETINEHVLLQNTNCPTEVVVSKTTTIDSAIETPKSVNKGISKVDSSTCIVNGTKENKVDTPVVKKKQNNWDAALRASIGSGSTDNVTPKPKKKKVSTGAKSRVSENKSANKSVGKKTVKKKTIVEPQETVDSVVAENPMPLHIKPNINIITDKVAHNNLLANAQSSDKNVNRLSNEDVADDTPETERLLLQNVIGAKLNISDLLETPYKQALYDIQMETPRFLAPDILDMPMSDIKIMNIPTPRFLTTPKVSQATPSSYSSRPTDYSSGGSYYKPDEQDYSPLEGLDYPIVSSTKENIDTLNTNTATPGKSSKPKSSRSSRPVRKCTKNVSYYNSPFNKNAEPESNDAVASTSKDMSAVDDTKVKNNKTDQPKAAKANKVCKNTSLTRVKKTPIKKEGKNVPKIKPRRPTPKKAGRPRKSSTGDSAKRKSISKDSSSKSVVSLPTKSRRKSSTPRKLHCTKMFNSESSGNDSPEIVEKSKPNVPAEEKLSHDSDTEISLRWIDDGSQETKDEDKSSNSITEIEDIAKIKAFIADSTTTDISEETSCLHIDLIKRGFDVETARKIERDLLDTSPDPKEKSISKKIVTEVLEVVKTNVVIPEKILNKSSDEDILQVDNSEEDEEVEEIELSVQECHVDSENYIFCNHEELTDMPRKPPISFKDTFSMEICIDDGETIRLRATPFNVTLNATDAEMISRDPAESSSSVVSGVTSYDQLYTPVKESIKAQCYEIFDSTLTSLDTPLKVDSPNRSDRRNVTVTEIVLEVEKVEVKKRKRQQSGNVSDDSSNENKRAKPEDLLNSANIQNIDIESVLCKLHGP